MQAWIALIANATPTTLLALIMVFGVVALWRRWVIVGWTYDDLKVDGEKRYQEIVADRDFYKDLALRMLDTAQGTVEIAKRTTRRRNEEL